MRRIFLATLLLTLHTLAAGATVKIAVASNFTAPMREIATRFQEISGHRAVVSYGSTGKLYTQILHGAPFQVFLSADQERPKLLHQAGRSEQPRTYAIGKLVLWSNDPTRIDDQRALLADSVHRIAIANPKTAPYGVGAMQVLKVLDTPPAIRKKLVRGDNIAQTYQFVMTGNAQLGFVALSQVSQNNTGSSWIPPQSLYEPLRQDAVLLQNASDNPAALAFMTFLYSPEAQSIAQQYGYGVE